VDADDVVTSNGRARVGERVRVLCRVYDRIAPALYSAASGDIGRVYRVVYAGEIREWLVHVEFGMMVAVVNARCLAVQDERPTS
jgi:hypothetical protein